jgi:hypothetical protein
MRSSKNVSLNQLFSGFHGVLGIVIDNWVWYRRIGGGGGEGICVTAPGQQSPRSIKKGLQKEYFKLHEKKLVFCSQKILNRREK